MVYVCTKHMPFNAFGVEGLDAIRVKFLSSKPYLGVQRGILLRVMPLGLDTVQKRYWQFVVMAMKIRVPVIVSPPPPCSCHHLADAF